MIERYLKFLFLLLCFHLINVIHAINDCSSTKSTIPTQTITKVVYKFTCNAVDIPNPSLPTVYGTATTEYNEINLSPNFFSILPINQLCLYTNVYSINLSYNQIASLSNAFVSLACLSGLKSLDFSYNSVITPLLARDFSDSLAATIIYLNLNNNQIPYIQTSTFIRADGSSRFPNLLFIGLASNQLKTFDLLWPLSLPNLVLQVDIKNNQIDTLVNELGKKYSESTFANPITGYRYVDCTGNNLKSISDWNLLQYGLNTDTDFQLFLSRISNFDFRSISNTPFLSCYCPSSGLYLNTWYNTIKSSVNMDAPINKLTCANMNNINIFAFPCAITNGSLSVGSSNLIAAAAAAGLGASASDQSSNSSTQPNLKYLLFLLLIIPVSILVFVFFFCFFGRVCQLFLYKKLKCLMCPCLRPDSGTMAAESGKTYDASICYSDYDEDWIDRDFIPKITELRRGYNLKKVSLSQRITKEIENEFKSSKRIVILFTKQFIDRDWEARRLHKILKRTSLDDPNSVLIAVNKTNLTNETLRSMIANNLKSEEDSTSSKGNLVSAGDDSNDDDRYEKNNAINRLRQQLKFNIIRSLTLNDIEVINYNEANFWTQFAYLMPQSNESTQNKINEITDKPKPPRLPFRYNEDDDDNNNKYNNNDDYNRRAIHTSSLPRLQQKRSRTNLQDLDDDFRLPKMSSSKSLRRGGDNTEQEDDLNYEGSTFRLKKSKSTRSKHRSDESLDRTGSDRREKRISYLEYGDYASVPRETSASQRSRSNDFYTRSSTNRTIYEDDFESDIKYMNR